MLDTISKLPKIELHAHLHGSIRKQTLVDIAGSTADMGSGKFVDVATLVSSPANLKNCFQIFDVIHHTIQSKEAVSRVAREVLQDFMEDNVIYLELRTTPRGLEDGTTMEDYVLLITEILDEHNRTNGHKMQARLLVSLDRSKPGEDAQHVIDVAIKSSKTSNAIVGIDFSGNPVRGFFNDFLPALENARAAGFKVTLHAAEVAEPTNEAETQIKNKFAPLGEMDSIIRFRPDRLGHAVKLTDSHISQLLALHESGGRTAPLIEICPSSNIVTLQLEDVKEHPTLPFWLEKDYPVLICTDDWGVFSSSLSQEWLLVHERLGLTLHQIAAMTLMSIDYIFDEAAKTQTRERYIDRLAQAGLQHILDAPPPASPALANDVSEASEIDSGR